MEFSKHISKIIFGSLLLSVAMPLMINAYPISYRRLILKEKGKVVKVVDLIGDYHIPEIFDKPRDMGPSEKELLKTLQKLGRRKTGEKIEVFGESSRSSLVGQYSKGTIVDIIAGNPIDRYLFSPAQGLVKINGTLYREFHRKFELRFLPPVGMFLPDIFYRLLSKDENKRIKSYGILAASYGGWLALQGIQHLVSNKNKKLIYSHGDVIRRRLFSMADPLFIKTILSFTGLIKEPRDQVASAKMLKTVDNLMRKEFNTLFKINPKVSIKLQALWNEYKQKGLNKKVVISDLDEIMDYEVLAKLFQSNQKHIVVIAGAFHCNNIADTLMEHFEFTEHIKVGNDNYGQLFGCLIDISTELRGLGLKRGSNQWKKESDKRMKVSFPPIAPSVWKNLESMPS